MLLLEEVTHPCPAHPEQTELTQSCSRAKVDLAGHVDLAEGFLHH